ncbi:MAG: CapA family protein [Saprospiraceae bacterium]
MKVFIPSLSVDEANWNAEKKRKYFSVPYSFGGCLKYLSHVITGPSQRFQELAEELETGKVLNKITPKLTLGFIGDIMPSPHRTVKIGTGVKSFFAEADYLVGNFEGTMITPTAQRVFGGLVHQENILSVLADWFPPSRTILTCANNHTGDFGWSQFNYSYQLLKDRGFLAIGRRDEPSIILGDNEVQLTCATRWSNQPCSYVAQLSELAKYHSPATAFQMLCPHWGYEMMGFANPKQIKQGKKLLAKWDAIIGHHAHVPQQVSSYALGEKEQLLAYSLGNFGCDVPIKKYHFGLILKLTLGTDAQGRWAVGKIDYQKIEAQFDRETVRVDTI